MSCIVVLDIEFADRNIIKELGVFFIKKFSVTRLNLQKSTNQQRKHFGEQKICMELFGTVNFWITVSFQTFFLELLRVNSLQNKQKNAKFSAVY